MPLERNLIITDNIKKDESLDKKKNQIAKEESLDKSGQLTRAIFSKLTKYIICCIHNFPLCDTHLTMAQEQDSYLGFIENKRYETFCERIIHETGEVCYEENNTRM